MSTFTETARTNVARTWDTTDLRAAVIQLEEGYGEFITHYLLNGEMAAQGLGDRWLASARNLVSIYELAIKIAAVNVAILDAQGCPALQETAARIDRHALTHAHYAEHLAGL